MDDLELMRRLIAKEQYFAKKRDDLIDKYCRSTYPPEASSLVSFYDRAIQDTRRFQEELWNKNKGKQEPEPDDIMII